MSCRRAVGTLVVIAAACGAADGAAPPVPLILCSGPLTVAVARSNAPRVSWSPSCGATYLEVVATDSREVMWIVQGDTGKVAPGVSYGTAPPAYRNSYGPEPLVRGAAYDARVGVMVDENSFVIFGERTFVH